MGPHKGLKPISTTFALVFAYATKNVFLSAKQNFLFLSLINNRCMVISASMYECLSMMKIANQYFDVLV